MDPEYSHIFDNELDQLDDQYNKTNELFEKVSLALDKNITRMNDKAMFGTTSPYRDISELSKSAASIRQTALSITHERVGIKKTIAELEIKAKQTKTDAQNAMTSETLMKDILSKIQSVPELDKKIMKQQSDHNTSRGMERLANLDPKDLGINENDIKSISRFKGNLDKKI